MRLRERLTYANVVSTLCLVLLLIGGGTAYALGKNTVGSPQIINGQVKTKDLGKTSVSTRKIKKNAVIGAKVKNGSLSGKDLRPRAAGVALAGLTIAKDGRMLRWFNRVGGKPTVSRATLGWYWVTVPGADPTPGIMSITPLTDSRRSCVWSPAGGDGFAVVCDSDSDVSVVIYAE